MSSIEPIQIDGIKPDEWAKILDATIQSRSSDKEKDPSYIVSDGRKYHVLKASQINHQYSKLSVQDIVGIFKDILQQIKNNADPPDWRLVGNIRNHTNTIINQRVKKRYRLSKSVLRGIGYAISAVSSVVLIGIPFFIKLRNADQKFAKEISDLQGSIEEPLAKELKKRAIELVTVAIKAPKSKDDNYRRGFIKGTMKGMLPSEFDFSKDVSQFIFSFFQDDVSRGHTFRLIDKEKNEIDDISPQPQIINLASPLPQPQIKLEELESLRIKGFVALGLQDPLVKKPEPISQKVLQAKKLLDDLTSNYEANKKWMPVLQLVIGQINLNALSNGLKGVFTNLVNSKSLYWQDPKTGKLSPLQLDFSERPPVEIIIFRDTGNLITEIKVKAEGSLDLLASNMEVQHLIQSNVVKGTLEYTVKFDDTNRPQITDVKSELIPTFTDVKST